jgi:hypothetical protein
MMAFVNPGEAAVEIEPEQTRQELFGHFIKI